MSPATNFGRRCANALREARRRRHNLTLPRWFSATSSTATADRQSPSPRSPPPIRVALTESAGRGVFATRRIGAGDLIHTAEPLVAHPSLSGFYEVEKQVDWSAYDDYCRTQGLKYPLLVKRLACMVISGAASAESLDILQQARLQAETVLGIEEEFCMMKSTLSNAGFKDEQIDFLTKQWYTGVLARIRINAFRVELIGGLYEDLFLTAAASVDAEAALGNAVYILPSFYNHDCDPNVHILWIDNTTARLKALREIEAGEELRICYIDASMEHNARKALLFNGFGFECTCLRCSSGD